MLSKKDSSIKASDYKNKRYLRTLKSVKAIAVCHNVTPVQDDDSLDVSDDEFDRVTISTGLFCRIVKKTKDNYL